MPKIPFAEEIRRIVEEIPPPAVPSHAINHSSLGADPIDLTGLTGAGITELTGDVTAGPGSGVQATVIPANTVTYAKMQDVSATDRFLGRKTVGAGDIEELTGTEATVRLDVFTSTLKGVAPSSGGGTTNFLRADGSWAAPTAAAGDLDIPEVGSLTVATAKYHLAAVRHSVTTTQRITVAGTGRLRIQN